MPKIVDHDSENSEPIMEGGSSKGPKSDISGGRSANSANRSRAPSYAPSAGAKSGASGRSDNTQLIKGGGRGGTRRSARDYQKNGDFYESYHLPRLYSKMLQNQRTSSFKQVAI